MSKMLFGLVAIVVNGQVRETRNLGNTPIQTKDNVFPLVEVRPPLGPNEEYGAPVYTIGADTVTATYSVVPPPTADELADQLNSIVANTSTTELALRAVISLISDQIFTSDPDPVSRDTKAKTAVRNRMKAIAEGTRG